MKYDGEIAAIIFAGITYYFVQKNVVNMLVWVGLTYLVAKHYFNVTHTVAMLLGFIAVYVIAFSSTGYTLEMFENEKNAKPTEPAPKTSKATDPHVDVGTTILHAYRNLTPEQIGGMRRDTKELMELQKELMGTLAEMKPAIEQGAQMLGSFTQFFGSS
jgi:hypothetical protein